MKSIFKVLSAIFLLAFSLQGQTHAEKTFSFVALGDMPYSVPDDYVRYERLISSINKVNPSFSIFVGDTKSGSTLCSNENNLIVKNYFNRFTSPLIYSIGDNEWVDCHRALAGSYDPLERLSDLRLTFFNSKKSLGKKKIDLVRQADIEPQYGKFVENSYWVKNQFLFVNLHIPGSNNNFERNDEAKSEYLERNQANLDWIKSSFALASTKRYKGIIFSYQADMFYSPKQAIDASSGYRDTLNLLSNEAQKLQIPILLIHGDSHRLIVDQPLKTADQKYIIEHVLRLQVMGAEQIQAVEVTVNPMAEQPFGFTPILLKRNMKNDGLKKD